LSRRSAPGFSGLGDSLKEAKRPERKKGERAENDGGASPADLKEKLEPKPPGSPRKLGKKLAR
jgi:hypothetical protein